MTEPRRSVAWLAPALLIAALPVGGAALGQGAAPGADEPEASAARPDADLEMAGRAAAERLGVDFLGVEPVEMRGRRLASVRVMEPGGNSNAAFLVQTLVVDPETGEVLGTFPGVDARSSGFPPGFDAPVTEPGVPPSGRTESGG